jgi:hypothetical protein
MIFSVNLTAKQIEQRIIETYTFNYYSSFLNSVLVPEIEEYVLTFNILPYTKEKGRELVDGVIKIIGNHLEAFNIIVPPGRKYPVSLIITPPDNTGAIVYFVNIILPLIEYNDNAKMTSVLMFSKNFFCAKLSLLKKKNI